MIHGAIEKNYLTQSSITPKMANLNVAILGPEGYAKNIGKKGTATDIAFYNLKRGTTTVTLIEPTRYPERLAPLFYAASMSGCALIVIDRTDHIFAEKVLMLNSLEIRKGYIVLQNYLSEEQIAPFISGTVLEGYQTLPDDPVLIREELLAFAATLPEHEPEEKESSCGTVTIDHHFNVKGIGTVILGGVERGFIRKHDILTLLPEKKDIQLRSIQKHDDNAEWAVKGDRVGLALKNIDADQLDRGDVLTNDRDLISSSGISGNVELVPYWKTKLSEGMVVHTGHWMQFITGRITSSGGSHEKPEITIDLEKEIVCLPGEKVVLHYLDGGKLRIIGTITI